MVASETVKALIGMSNRGDEDFIVTLVEGSLRYPQDFSFHIQNVSSVVLLQCCHVVCVGLPRGLNH